VTSLRMVRRPLGRPKPHIVIEAVRHRLGRPGRLAFSVVVGDADSHRVQVADASVDDQLAGLVKLGPGTLLRTRLQDAAVTLGLIGQPAALGDCQRKRLFAVNILARAHSRDGNRHVPMVGRSDQNRVDIGPRQHVAEILAARLGIEARRLGGLFGVACIDIAYGHHLAVALAFEALHIACALAAHADAAHRDAVARRIGPENRRRNYRRQSDGGRSCDRARHELSAAQISCVPAVSATHVKSSFRYR